MHRRIREVIAATFDVPQSSIPDDCGPSNIEQWDSMGHLNLVVEVERTFRVRLSADEILAIRSARDIQELLARRHALSE